MMKKLFLLRHGETQLNLKKVYYGRTDCDLTQKGVEQAAVLTSFFSVLHLDLVYESPLLRAKHTADIVLAQNPVERVRDDRLRELDFGAWEGKSYQELTGDPVYTAWCNDWQNTRPPQGESFCDLVGRTQSFYRDLIKSEAEDILIVGHHAVLQQLMAYLLEEEADRCWHYAFDQGAYTVFEFSGEFAVLKGHNLIPISEN